MAPLIWSILIKSFQNMFFRVLDLISMRRLLKLSSVQTDVVIVSVQAKLMAKGDEANRKGEMVKKLRSMIDLYTPPKDRQLRCQQVQ